MEECARCKEVGDDRRTLWMACFYQMMETGVPFKQIAIRGKAVKYLGEENISETLRVKVSRYADPDEGQPEAQYQFYTLRVCKSCRADWMDSITQWFNQPCMPPVSTGTGVYTRRNGSEVELTPEEVTKWEDQ